jgi:hypothetical protein
MKAEGKDSETFSQWEDVLGSGALLYRYRQQKADGLENVQESMIRPERGQQCTIQFKLFVSPPIRPQPESGKTKADKRHDKIDDINESGGDQCGRSNRDLDFFYKVDEMTVINGDCEIQPIGIEYVMPFLRVGVLVEVDMHPRFAFQNSPASVDLLQTMGIQDTQVDEIKLRKVSLFSYRGFI